MKKNYITILAGLICFSTFSQTNVTDFEDLSLSIDTFWNGVDKSGSFTSNTVIFKNKYDTSWGGFWSAGASYSTMRNDSTPGAGNQYSSIAGEGYNSSQTYAVFTPNSDTAIIIPNYGALTGFWVNNSTYAYLSMKNGDSFAKKFGDSTNASGANDGTNGNDWFKLTIYGTNSDSVEFYLADFRGSDSTDYIVKDWSYVDLSTLNPNSKSLTFKLSSSDTGRYGMNTPKYFCMDNFTYTTYVSVPEISENSISVFPNPTKDRFEVNFRNSITNGTYKLLDVTGREIVSARIDGASSLELDLSNQENGTYFIVISTGNSIVSKRIIKY